MCPLVNPLLQVNVPSHKQEMLPSSHTSVRGHKANEQTARAKHVLPACEGTSQGTATASGRRVPCTIIALSEDCKLR